MGHETETYHDQSQHVQASRHIDDEGHDNRQEVGTVLIGSKQCDSFGKGVIQTVFVYPSYSEIIESMIASWRLIRCIVYNYLARLIADGCICGRGLICTSSINEASFL